MKNVTMISRRSFLKAAMAASAVSALAFTGCGGSASSTVAASSTASSAAASAAAEGGQTFKVGIVNYVDHASLNQIVESVESRLDELGAEKGVTFDYADYYANAQADQSNLNQIGADLVGDGVDVIVAVATPTDNTVMTAELSIYETFTEAGVQHYTGADSFALNGAFVGYGVDYVQLGEATADMVAEILCDSKTTADLPYQTFDNGIVTINTETCEALGLDLDTVKEAFKPYCTEIVEVTTAENFS